MVIKGKVLDEFTVAYLSCMLFAENDNSDDSGGEPLDRNYDIEDLTERALEIAIADCEKFQKENQEDIEKTPDWNGYDSYTSEGYTGVECAAHDFWFTRCHHGTGFWDREWYDQETKDRLTKAAHKFGECTVIVNDSGEVELS